MLHSLRVRNDLEDPKASILGGCTEEGPISIIVFVLTGRASPHLHNGVLHVGDENTYVSHFKNINTDRFDAD